MKTKHIIGVLIMLGAGIFGATAFEGTLTPYVNFAQAQETQSRCQVMGEIIHDSTRYELSTHMNLFTVANEDGQMMRVSYAGIMPGNFEQAESVVIKGEWDGRLFAANELLVKCPSKYQGTEGDYMTAAEADDVPR